MITLLADHLWQPTLVAAVIGVLVVTLRGNRPQVRYRLWLAASMKFLVPLAVLVAIGTGVGRRLPDVVLQPELTGVIGTMSQPFSAGPGRPAAQRGEPDRLAAVRRVASITLMALWLTGALAILVTWWVRWCRVAAAVRTALPLESGRELEALRRLERAYGRPRAMALVSSNTSFEPGVFGIVTPVLLWPRSISEHLDDRQIEAIIAHELAHAGRRDNLAAALHMIVQAVFWFHPVVRWIGKRLLDERERACDEDVIRRVGCVPQTYAEGILKTCELYIESPLACVAGVTGSNLKRRIEEIMNNDAAAAMTGWRKLLLLTTALVVTCVPIAVGVLTAPRARAQTSATAIGRPFTAVSIKPNTSGDSRFNANEWTPDGKFVAKNTTVNMLIRNLYPMPGGRMMGQPRWVNTDRFDIEAQADGQPDREQRRAMVRRLLADYFQLQLHNETQQLPIYALVLVTRDGTTGPRLRSSTPECVAAAEALHSGTAPPPRFGGPSEPSQVPCGGVSSRTGTITARAATMEKIAGGFALLLGRVVVDQTGLTGHFDADVAFTPATVPPSPPPTVRGGYGMAVPFIGPAFFAAVEEQLGVRLDPQTGPVDLLVIDRVERPQ
jgi:bla regulator protein BlaR1